MKVKTLGTLICGTLAFGLCACDQSFGISLSKKPQATDTGPSKTDPSNTDPAHSGSDPSSGPEMVMLPVTRPVPPDNRPSPVLCDPFSPENAVSAVNGLAGELRFAEPGRGPQYRSVFDFQSMATLVKATLILNDLNVQPRLFSAGFGSTDVQTLKDPSGQILNEYFSIHLKSNLVLTAADQEAHYQFALLADDGAVMSALDPESGKKMVVVDDDGVHAPRFACGPKAIRMSHASRLATQVDYFQGPRYHIALMLLWRPVSSADAALDPLCQNVSPAPSPEPRFFEVSTQATRALPDYDALLKRGWEPVPAENFLLQEGTNKCAQMQAQ